LHFRWIRRWLHIVCFSRNERLGQLMGQSAAAIVPDCVVFWILSEELRGQFKDIESILPLLNLERVNENRHVSSLSRTLRAMRSTRRQYSVMSFRSFSASFSFSTLGRPCYFLSARTTCREIDTCACHECKMIICPQLVLQPCAMPRPVLGVPLASNSRLIR